MPMHMPPSISKSFGETCAELPAETQNWNLARTSGRTTRKGSRFLCFGAFVLATLAFGFRVSAADNNPLISSWLGAQTNIQTWSADFVQIRTFKSLTQPLMATGHVWFAEPNRFRWELGHPPQPIAVSAPKELLVIYPRLKRVERYPLSGGQTGPWQGARALLEAGFPRSQAELESRFLIQSQTFTNHTCQLVLQPRSGSARKMM